MKIAISYFSDLNAKGELSEKEFKVLVRYACSILIENEVESRIKEVLADKFTRFLNKILSSSQEEFCSKEGEKKNICLGKDKSDRQAS